MQTEERGEAPDLDRHHLVVPGRIEAGRDRAGEAVGPQADPGTDRAPGDRHERAGRPAVDQEAAARGLVREPAAGARDPVLHPLRATPREPGSGGLGGWRHHPDLLEPGGLHDALPPGVDVDHLERPHGREVGRELDAQPEQAGLGRRLDRMGLHTGHQPAASGRRLRGIERDDLDALARRDQRRETDEPVQMPDRAARLDRRIEFRSDRTAREVGTETEAGGGEDGQEDLSHGGA
jgi:hypothetical protein